MKKIHCYITSLEGGGAERQMAYLCDFLAERGYDVTLVTMLSKPDKYYISPIVKRYCFGYQLDDNVFIKFLKKLSIFFYFLTIKTDCVISFLIGPNVHVLKPMRFRSKVKVIISERNLVTWELNKYEQKAYGKIYNRANYVISNSYSMEKYLSDYNPLLKPHLRTITNYTDIRKYRLTRLPLKEKLNIGVFARYEKQKNYLRFAEMLNKIKELEHRPFIVNWYGDITNQSCYSHFCKLIKKYNINDMIQLNDFVSDVPKEMEEIDIICLPSLYEGFSNSLAEAICCGKPVIAGNVSDNNIMVKEGVNGRLFDPNDINDMIKTFLSVVNASNESLINMSCNSREIAESLFSKEKFVDSYIEVIEH